MKRTHDELLPNNTPPPLLYSVFVVLDNAIAQWRVATQIRRQKPRKTRELQDQVYRSMPGLRRQGEACFRLLPQFHMQRAVRPRQMKGKPGAQRGRMSGVPSTSSAQLRETSIALSSVLCTLTKIHQARQSTPNPNFGKEVGHSRDRCRGSISPGVTVSPDRTFSTPPTNNPAQRQRQGVDFKGEVATRARSFC